MNFDKLCLKCMQEKIENGVCTFCSTKKEFVQQPVFALPASRILHGRYLVGAVLGHGGFGITYMGMDLKTNQRVAIKEFMPDGLSTRVPGTTTVTVHSNSEDYSYGLKQFVEEARTIYKYSSNPNIISVNALFEENNTAYYVMEYLDGCDLKQYLSQRGGTISYNEALRLLSPVFDALSAVHKQNIIHRDVSPDNIYICKNGQVKLLDFGAARVALMGKSKSLSVILKRGYAPLEQYYSHGIQGPWTDIYALAATLYKCITGQIPLEATERLHGDDLIPPSRLCRDIPGCAEGAIIKALSVKREDRYHNIDEFKYALEGKIVDFPKKQDYHPKLPSQNLCPSQDAPPNAGKRIAALLIDGVIIYLLSTLLLRSAAVSLKGYYALTFVTGVLYGSLCEASDMRGTLGKKLMGLKVSDAYGNKLDKGKAIIRNLIKYCPSALAIFLPYYIGSIFGIVNYGSALSNSQKQTLHDKAAGSFVTGKSMAPQGKNAYQHVMVTKKAAAIECVSGYYTGTQFPINDAVTLGRNPEACNIIFPNDVRGVSGIHCQLHFDKGLEGVIIKDMGSTYGTQAGSQRLSGNQSAVLHDGDSFTIGENNRFTIHIR